MDDKRGENPVFSVIIPLEFHRGIAGKCIRAWTAGQDFPRERFEIIVAAPEGHDVAELDLIESLLGAGDRLMRLPLHHDMDLVAAAAKEASGDLLLFTESHCLPNPDVLRRAESILQQKPQWAGFSGGSIPVTHNMLSGIEADMYAADIQRNMESHPWLKVLDQILVLRRAAYLACGGIEPEYGHFAEWLLAARLHLMGARMGYEPSVAVHHHYIGDLDDLIEFSEDFGRGQMRLEMQRGKDPATALFDPLMRWGERFEFQPMIARRMLQLMWRNRSGYSEDGERMERSARWRSCLRRALAGTALEWHSACATVRRLRAKTESALASGDRSGARDAFLQMIQACAAKGQLSMLRDGGSACVEEARAMLKPVKNSGRWNCEDPVPALKAGFFPRDRVFGKTFCWTLPEAIVWLPLAPGKYEVRVDWIGFSQLRSGSRYRFYADGHPVPPRQTLELPHGMEIQLDVKSRHGVWLGWTCAPFHSPGDVRSLGMPLTGVVWKRLKPSAKLRSPVRGAGRKDSPPWEPRDFTRHEPLYFLHVSKCMGTAVRFFLENAFSAEQILAPWNQFYHLNQLDNDSLLRQPRRFVRGHLRWELMDRVQDRDWRIVTVFREPRERLLSLFDFLKQMGRLPSALTLEEWLRTDHLVVRTLAGFFMVGAELDPAVGAREAGRSLQRHADEAMAHLRQCRVVGLQERPEETLNLLAWATGVLPPAELRRVNVSERRNFRDGLSPEAREMLAELTVVDHLLYEEGCRMFEAQHAVMLEHLRQETGRILNPREVRAHLRARALARLEREQKSRSHRSVAIKWNAADVFPGENLDNRELHDGVMLRWTGPHEETRFHFAIEAGAGREMTIRLHPATPMEHARVAELWMDEQPVALHLRSDIPGVAGSLHGRITPEMLKEGDAMRCFRLRNPVKRAANEWRMLGLCICSMEFRAIPASDSAN